MGWAYVFILIFLVVAVYTVIPDFLLHRLGFGSWKRQYTGGVALSFDDGPNPEITPQILDILAGHKVTATFFLVGKRAAANPELVKLIIDKGHKIGAHSQGHRYAWFRSPWATWRDWEQCTATLEHISGQNVDWIRPPWGTFNLVTWIWSVAKHKRPVLWNVEGHDWLAANSPGQISEKVLRRVKEGSIIVLHDSGGEQGAPQNTLKALDMICQRIVQEKKLPLVELEFPAWSKWHRFYFSLWEKWEQLFAKWFQIERVDAYNLFRLSKSQYKGPKLYSEAGELLAQEGDTVAEIHFDNSRLLNQETDMQRIGLKALRYARESLPGLAGYVAKSQNYRDIQVFLGLTLINRGVKGFGFHVQDVPVSGFSRWVGMLQRAIMRVYHPTGKERNTEKLGAQPKLVWISRQELLSRWLPKQQDEE